MNTHARVIRKLKILGYDFYISPSEDVEDIENFIRSEIEASGQPIISVVDKGVVEVEKIRFFTKKKIKACIKQGYVNS